MYGFVGQLCMAGQLCMDRAMRVTLAPDPEHVRQILEQEQGVGEGGGEEGADDGPEKSFYVCSEKPPDCHTVCEILCEGVRVKEGKD